jgi:hypothetical protein
MVAADFEAVSTRIRGAAIARRADDFADVYVGCVGS